MKFSVAVLPGDGIGPEVIVEAIKVMKAIGDKYGHEFDLRYGLIGGVAIDEEGTAFSDKTLKICKECDAV